MSSFTAQVRAWSEKDKRNAEFVVRGSIQDVAEIMSVPRDGLVRGAPFQVGVVPVDEGQLIGSLTVEIDGSPIAQGNAGSATPPDYTAALAGMEIGAYVKVVFTAPHARPIEYGFRVRDDNSDNDNQYSGGDVDVPGRFMVRGAVQQWQTVVDQNAALFKD